MDLVSQSRGITWAKISSNLECSIWLNNLIFSLKASSVFLFLFLRLGDSLRLWTSPLLSPAIIKGSDGLKASWLRTPWLLLSIF